MIDSLQSQATDAGRLVGYGIRPRHRPANDTDYQALVLRFLADRDFERMVTAVASGQGLSVIACDRMEGLVLAPTDDSPYRLRLADYIQLPSAETRLLHGIVQLAIGATAYPTAAALETRRASFRSRPLRSTSASCAWPKSSRGGSGETTRPRKTQSPKRSGTSCLACVPLTRPPTTGTLPTTCSVRSKRLRWLSEHGLADEVEGTNDAWRLRERYRLNVLAASGGAFELFQSQHSATNEEAMP